MASSSEGHQRAAAAPAQTTPTAASLSTHRLGGLSPSQACIGSPHIWLESGEGTLGLCNGGGGGGPQCRRSILRYGNVAWHCRLFSPLLDIKLKKRLLDFYPHVACH